MLVYAAIIFTPGFIYFPLYKILLTLYSEDSGDTYFCQFYTEFSFLDNGITGFCLVNDA